MCVMIRRVNKKLSKKQVLSSIDPVIKEWFNNNFKDLTPAQAYAIPIIQKGKNVLVASPTGSGKTLTAFLMILNRLFQLGKKEKLENKVYCLYISPLKALANDIERNLNLPLNQIYKLASEHGIKLPDIRVGVRSGDTSTAERQKMTRKVPHILITTPESLSIIISTKKFRLKLLDTQYVIVDEIHEVCSSKRGSMLSLSLERLQNQILIEGSGQAFIRIGLSATQAPITEIAKFLGGYDRDQKLRDMNIVEVPAQKKLDLKVICPVKDINLVPFEIINAKMYNILFDLIKEHRTTLIFTNTRSGAETVAYRLHEKGLDDIAAHHGSLSKETRLEVEDKLKNGELDATICSTSLELGIDIGYIDLVCQIGSPKSIAKGLQRIGRSGHALHEVSMGRVIVFDRDDLVECAVLVKNAYDGNIDRINILMNNLDVLAQALVGMSLERRWDLDEAFLLIKQSYCFHKLPKKDFLKVMNYIGGKHTMEDRGIYGKVRYYPEDNVFGIRKGVRIIYNMNIGTIPQEANYRVVILGTGYTVGVLSEKFVEHFTNKDVFVLGGKTYEYIQTKGMKVYVKDAHGRKPTVPSWTGEMLPRSFDLSSEIGKFRGDLGRRINDVLLVPGGCIDNQQKQLTNPITQHEQSPKMVEKFKDIETWLKNEYYLDSGSAISILNYFIEQSGMIQELPTNRNLLIEGYIDNQGYKNIIFHYCFGRRVNDALSRAYAYELSKKLRCTVRISLTDDNFMLTFPKHIEMYGIERLVKSKDLRKTLKAALKNTELFKQRFRHCAVRSFMILRSYKGKDISVRKQLKRSSRMLEFLNEQLADSFPVINESYNEILTGVMDIKHAEELLRKIENGMLSVSYSNYSKTPSPFAHNVILIGISDIILMEDRSALLRELHQQVLTRIFGSKEFAKPKFEIVDVKNHFKSKIPIVENKEGIISLLIELGPLRLFKEKGKNIFSYISPDIAPDIVQEWSHNLVTNGKIVSIKRNNNLFWVPKDHLNYYLTIYSDRTGLLTSEHLVLDWLSKADKEGRNVPARLSLKVISQELQEQKRQGQAFPLPIKELRDVLKRLESRYLVHRSEEMADGSIIWYTMDKDIKPSINFEEAVDFLIFQYLKYYAPAPLSETAYNLALTEELVNKRLSVLESEKTVVSGNFVLGKDVPQYMLKTDQRVLEQKIKKVTEKLQVIDEKLTSQYLVSKIFKPVENIAAFFKKFGFAFGVREVFIRTKNFTLEKWNSIIRGKHRKIAFGRFLNGRVCYVPLTDVPLYVSAYRRASLSNIELTVLNIIRTQRGLTRLELSKKLDARQIDIKEIIEKLERNLYIIREPLDYDSGLNKPNRYVYFELIEKVEKSRLKIIQKILKGQSPLSIFDIKNLSGFNIEFIKKSLDLLINDGEIVKFKMVGENNVEMYITKKEFNILGNLKPNENDRVRLLSLFDSYSYRFIQELRVRFGEGWLTAVVYHGKLIGTVDLWRLSSCIEIRNIQLDDDLINDLVKSGYFRNFGNKLSEKGFYNLKLEILKQILEALDHLMDYYKMHDLDIIRIRNIFDLDSETFPQELLDGLTSVGYTKLHDFFVKGDLDTNVFDSKQIMGLILDNQHILPTSRFVNPLKVIRTMGGIRSNLEMQLRLDGKFYDIKEFRKNLNLVAGPIIPDHYSYCTDKDIRIYKIAKGRDMDMFMEYILQNMPDDFSISSNNLFSRLTLSRDQFNSARRKLYEGLYIIRDPINKYMKVGDYRNLTRNYARKFVLKRIIKNFGIFSSENLSSFTKREYPMKELKKILRELEREGVVKKGFFRKDDDILYWMTTESVEKLLNRKMNYVFSGYLIVSPQDQLISFLAAELRKLFGFGSCFIIIKDLEISGVFKVRKIKNKNLITDFVGDDSARDAVERFFRINKIELFDEETEELYIHDNEL